MFRHAFAALCLVPAVMSIAPAAQADEPPQLPPSAATAPPPGYGQPPPGYGQPPPGYGQPPPGYYPQPGQPYYQQADPRPPFMDYEDGQQIPNGYHLRTRVRGGLIGGGAGMLGGMWLISIITGAIGNAGHELTDGQEPWTPMYFPVVGPFITMATASNDLSGGGAALLAVDGVVQLGGTAMIILGIALPRKQLIRDDYGRPSLTVQPVFTGQGMALTGTF